MLPVPPCGGCLSPRRKQYTRRMRRTKEDNEKELEPNNDEGPTCCPKIGEPNDRRSWATALPMIPGAQVSRILSVTHLDSFLLQRGTARKPPPAPATTFPPSAGTGSMDEYGLCSAVLPVHLSPKPSYIMPGRRRRSAKQGPGSNKPGANLGPHQPLSNGWGAVLQHGLQFLPLFLLKGGPEGCSHRAWPGPPPPALCHRALRRTTGGVRRSSPPGITRPQRGQRG